MGRNNRREFHSLKFLNTKIPIQIHQPVSLRQTKTFKITVKKISPPLGLVLTVFDGGKGVFIDEKKTRKK